MHTAHVLTSIAVSVIITMTTAFSWICDAVDRTCGAIRRAKSRASVVVPTNIATLRKIDAARSNEKANSHLLTNLLVVTRFPIPMVASASTNEPERRIMCFLYARPQSYFVTSPVARCTISSCKAAIHSTSCDARGTEGLIRNRLKPR